jgi:hypothetical protein
MDGTLGTSWRRRLGQWGWRRTAGQLESWHYPGKLLVNNQDNARRRLIVLCQSLAGVSQIGELVGHADPPGGGATALQAMPDNLAGGGLVAGDVADTPAGRADAAIEPVPAKAGITSTSQSPSKSVPASMR